MFQVFLLVARLPLRSFRFPEQTAARDRAQPGKEIRSGLVATQVSIRLDERQVRDFVHIHSRGAQPRQSAAKPLMIGGDDGAVVVKVSVPYALDGLLDFRVGHGRVETDGCEAAL